MSRPSVFYELRAMPLFSGLDDNNLVSLATQGRIALIEAGSLVATEQDPADDFHVVLSGKAKLYKRSPGGKEQIVYVFEAGEPFCLCAMQTGERYPLSAEAMERTRLFTVSALSFADALESDPHLAFNVIKVLSRRLKEAMALIESLSLKDLSERVAAFLIQARPSSGDSTYSLPVSQREIAKIVGVTPEALSRHFKKFADMGVVAVSGRAVVILNQKRLEELAGTIEKEDHAE
ncbi:Crp/Fnr family transcriptional regulator [Desulfovibrio inopinatus]|uniref:Crp/Fnr family transcriptional regulator n=1 Tax=Desulfovibrio inopinatus TaxID=102109 RepID=UPI00040956A9|nr:Crp/Fnr family transcriptional regulator [Desulfovibrio inopinatus]